MSEIIYRDFRIARDPKPIPTRAHDWDYWHEGYDGPEDRRCGTAASLDAAKAAIDEWCEEQQP